MLLVPRPHRPAACGVLAALASVLVVACTSAGPASSRAEPGAAAACTGWSTRDYADARVVRHLRIYTNPATGDSAIEDKVIAPRATPLLKTGKILVEYNFGASSKTQIVYGPADLEIPLHPAPYREAFLILQGSVVMKLADGTSRLLGPGDMTTYEDMDASHGHGGRTGPCGYVALNIVP